MAIPAHLNCSFDYVALTANSVDDIIAAFDALVVGGSLGWTQDSPATALYKSPVDATGRFFDVLLTKITATNLEAQIRDGVGATVCTVRMQIDAGNAVRIFAGAMYFHIEATRTSPAVAEWLRGGMLDLSPEVQNAHDQWCYGDGSRTAGDVFQSQYDCTYLYGKDNGVYQRMGRMALSATGSAGLISDIPLRSPAGGSIFMAASVYAQPAGETYGYFAGRMYQHLICPVDSTEGYEFKAPIDTGATGWFRVLVGNSGFQRLACRIPDPS